MTTTEKPATASGTFLIGGTTPVTRLGFGAMQLTGPGTWGELNDPDEAVRVLRRAVELGVDFIDTADSYGPNVSEKLIKQALYPYDDQLVIATKAGLTRPGPGQWRPLARPEYLRQQCENSLRNLGLETIKLYQLHRIDPKVRLEDQIGELVRLRDEGKITHIGMSEISIADLEAASRLTPVATVQNLYNLINRGADTLVDRCAAGGIGFIPWFPLATGRLATAGGRLAEVATSLGATPSQVALAWLLRRSPSMLPIPGTSSVPHVEENIAAATLELDETTFDRVSSLR